MVSIAMPTGIHAIVRALEEIQPGEEVRYGSQGDGHAVGLGASDYSTVLKLVEKLEAEDRIVRFHRHGYYVAQGVTPKAKQIVEQWAARHPLPARHGL